MWARSKSAFVWARTSCTTTCDASVSERRPAFRCLRSRQVMEGVVLVGSGIHARLAGYSSGGKTGSAQIYDYAAKRYTHNYNGSFMGFAPLTNPAVVVVVTLNGTHGGEAGFGGRVAAPTFKAVTEEALRIFDVPKDLPEPEKTKTLVARKEDLNDLAIADLGGGGPNILEDGDDEDAA